MNGACLHDNIVTEEAVRPKAGGIVIPRVGACPDALAATIVSLDERFYDAVLPACRPIRFPDTMVRSLHHPLVPPAFLLKCNSPAERFARHGALIQRAMAHAYRAAHCGNYPRVVYWRGHATRLAALCDGFRL